MRLASWQTAIVKVAFRLLSRVPREFAAAIEGETVTLMADDRDRLTLLIRISQMWGFSGSGPD
jgi:hypothetical protein